MSTLLAMSGANDAWPATLVKGAAAFTSTKQTYSGANPDDRTWTVPAGVWSIHVVLFGGGGHVQSWPDSPVYRAIGGSGGGCRWMNNIRVQPGEVLTIKMHELISGNMLVNHASDIGMYRASGARILWAGGGGRNMPSATALGGTGSPIGGNIGGGDGGDAEFGRVIAESKFKVNGAGAGGLTGKGGGNAGFNPNSPYAAFGPTAPTGDGRPAGAYSEPLNTIETGAPHGGGWSLFTGGNPARLLITAIPPSNSNSTGQIGGGAAGIGMWTGGNLGNTENFYGGRSACGIMWGDTRSFPSNLT